MKNLFVIFSIFFSLSSFSNNYQVATCIGNNVTVAQNPNVADYPGSIEENQFEFQRINEEVIHIKSPKYYFPDFPHRVEQLAFYEGQIHGLDVFKIGVGFLKISFQCDQNRVIIMMEGDGQIPPQVELFNLL